MRAAATKVRSCTRCGLEVCVTPSGHLRAHECPHGTQCVQPYRLRRVGEEPEHCALCAGAPDTRMGPGQMPIPFVRGHRKAVMRPKRVQRFFHAMGEARTCPVCGCAAVQRCAVVLEGGGRGECIPAGIHGRVVCSACRQPNLPGVE